MHLIGVDCATNPKAMGFARGRVSEGDCQIDEAVVGTSIARNVELVSEWLDERGPSLITIDAPLGWPIAMAQNLSKHRAGLGINAPPNEMFRRETDREIKARLNKQSLDVGADRIARTAHAALSFLSELRYATGTSLPLAWNTARTMESRVIEVYPAATLVAYDFRATGYKKSTDVAAREEILNTLSKIVKLPEDLSAMLQNADALDAAVCVLAGYDFVAGLSPGPVDLAVAKREGWIWARSPVAL